MIRSDNVNDLTVLKFFSLEQRVKQDTRNFPVITQLQSTLALRTPRYYQTLLLRTKFRSPAKAIRV